MSTIIFVHRTFWDEIDFSIISFFNIILSMLVLVFLINFYELCRKETAAFLERKNKELKSANEALELNRNFLSLILDSTGEGICGIDLKGVCTFCNESCLKILKYQSSDDLIGKNLHDLIQYKTQRIDDLIGHSELFSQTLLTGKSITSKDEVFWRADGTCFDVLYTSTPKYQEGIVIGAVITFTDITEQKENERMIKYLSCYDSLTGLYNRGYFLSLLKDLDCAENLPIAIVFADINGLKLTNDIFGHFSGDELIKTAADVLRKSCNEKDIIARVGGDEFIMLLPNTNTNEIKKKIHKINKTLSMVKIDAFKCSMSFGYDIKRSESKDIERIIENAESEMYKEKTMSRKNTNEEILHTIITTLHSNLPSEKKHSENVSRLCQLIGKAMNLNENNIRILKDAGYFHDIGKITVDLSVFNKISDSNEVEKEVLRQHPAVGYRILSLFDETLDISESVYSHHENWDGSGYPKGIKGDEIPLFARIISVCEAYDFYTNERNCPVLDKEQALQKIASFAGTKYDTSIVDVLFRIKSEI